MTHGDRCRLATCLTVLFWASGALAQPETTPAVAVPPGKPLPINLPTAMQLANAKPLDIALAAQRLSIAAAELDRAKVLWLPTVYLGVDYLRHDGQIQDVRGDIFTTSRGAFMVGGGPYAVFAITDALYAPLAAKQVVRARHAEQQAATNDSVLSVAEAYFNVQQARGELAAALDVVRRAEDLVHRAEQLAPGLAPPVEAARARAERARRRQVVHLARERWRTAGAELARLLRLDPCTLVDPMEAPHLMVTLVKPTQPVDDLIPVALHTRPELEAQQALVHATLERLKQEKMRPLIPSLWLRGAATNPAGTLSTGLFGAGRNDDLHRFNSRNSMDIQLLWEIQNLGFGNHARVDERKAQHQQAVVESLRTQDLVAAEVVRAHAQVESAAAREVEAASGLRDAVDSVEKNFAGLGQTKRLGGDLLILIIRPQEAVAAVQALAAAYSDYYGAVADYNRAQFRLYRALGHPAQLLTLDSHAPTPNPAVEQPPALQKAEPAR